MVKRTCMLYALVVWILLGFFSMYPISGFAVVETVRYSINPSDIEFRDTIAPDGNTYTFIKWNGKSSFMEAGSPDIPYDNVMFHVPQNTCNFRVTVALPDAKLRHKLSYPVVPVQPPVSLNEESCDMTYVKADSLLYRNNGGVLAEVGSDGFIFGNQHIVNVLVYPIAYYDDKQIVQIFSDLELRLEYDYCDVNDLKDTPLQPEDSSSEINVGSMFDFINKQGTTAIPRLLSSAADANVISSRYYYIIVPENLKDGVEDLAIWKRQKGYDVTVKTIESILRTPKYRIGSVFALTGDTLYDPACVLRAYLQDEFKKNGVFYCLLVGDYRTSMPVRKFKTQIRSLYKKKLEEYPSYENVINGDFFVPSDNYFSDLTTYHNLEFNSGEYVVNNKGSFLPDIIVGRLLCSNVKDLYNYFFKLKYYEAYPGKGDDDYLSSALYFENNPGCSKHSKNSLVGETQECIESLNIFPKLIYAQDIDIKESILDHTFPLYGSDVIKYMNRTGYNSWYGHGRPTCIQTCGEDYGIIPVNSYNEKIVGIPLDKDDRNNGLNLIDNKYFPSVTYSSACSIAPFDRYTFDTGFVFDAPYNMASAYTVGSKVGGVGIIANGRSGWIYFTVKLQTEFGKYVRTIGKFGASLAIGKNAFVGDGNVGLYCEISRSINLIGDPEFEMWLGRANNFNLQISNINGRPSFSSINGYDSNISIYCTLGNFPLGKLVYNQNLNGEFWNRMPLVSIWKRGYMPFIRLYAPQGNFVNIYMKYIPLDAYLGHIGNFNFSSPCIISSNAIVDIDALKYVEISDGFRVENGGRVNIVCNEFIHAYGEVVRSGGEVCISGNKILLSSGFKAGECGILKLTVNHE